MDEEMPKMKLTLDIGCGPNPKGDVNIDISYSNNVENFILADAENLPLKDKTFHKAFAFHALEHIKNPLTAIKEMKRVASITIIRVPAAYFEPSEQTVTHLYTWNQDTLNNFLKLIFKNVIVYYTSRKLRMQGRISKYLFFLRFLLNKFPIEIRAICWE